METIRHDNQHSLKEIVDLGGKSKEISKIMEIIDTVADQTKLIAFNAALEASSAGEAGKRFGVVAAEIRRLADSVTESTGEIAKKVGEIQESIGRLVITSEKGALGIEQGMDDSSRTAAVSAGSGARRPARPPVRPSRSVSPPSSSAPPAIRSWWRCARSSPPVPTRRNRCASIAQVTQEMTRLSADLKFQVDRFTLDETAARPRPRRRSDRARDEADPCPGGR